METKRYLTDNLTFYLFVFKWVVVAVAVIQSLKLLCFVVVDLC